MRETTVSEFREKTRYYYDHVRNTGPVKIHHRDKDPMILISVQAFNDMLTNNFNKGKRAGER